ncbi:MAG: hypothetical protein AAGB31_06675, partial [Bdellovibrio sp.]
MKPCIQPLSWIQKAGLLLMVTLFVTACSGGRHSGALIDTSRSSTPKTVGSASTPTMAEGSSSGGGSFGDESSMVILNRAVKELVQEIRFINPSAVPAKFDAEKLIALLQNLKLEPNKSASRYERELMLDYDATKGQEHIKVMSLLFKSHASIPVNYLGPYNITPFVDEVKLKLLHEAAHIFGIGTTEKTDHEARQWAQSFMDQVPYNNLLCVFGDSNEEYP